MSAGKSKLRKAVERTIGRSLQDKSWEIAMLLYGEEIDENDTGSAEFDEAKDSLVGSCKEWLLDLEESLLQTTLSARTALTGPIANNVKAWRFPALEEKRLRVMSDHCVRLADEHYLVRDFRDNVLNGKLLTVDEARQFLSSTACRFLTRTQFREWGIPVGDHKAKLIEESIEPIINPLTVVFRARLYIEPHGQEYEVTNPVSAKSWPQSFYYWDLQETSGPVEVWPGSLLDELRVISRDLRERHLWLEDHVPLYVLCGAKPIHLPVALDARGTTQTGNFVLHIAPWVSGATVKRMFQAFQKAMLGGPPHAIGEKSLELFQFINSRGEPRGRQGMWKQLMQEWNSAYSHRNDPENGKKWTYDSLRQFQRDYRERAREPLTNPLLYRRRKKGGSA